MNRKIIVVIIFIFMITACNKSVETDIIVESEIKNPIDFSPENVIANGDVVNLHGDLSNIKNLDKFIDNVKLGTRDSLRVVQYTIEGDPIIAELRFNGSTIHFLEDFTRDKFGSGKVMIDTFDAIEIRDISINGKTSKRVILFDDEHEYDFMLYPE